MTERDTTSYGRSNRLRWGLGLGLGALSLLGAGCDDGSGGRGGGAAGPVGGKGDCNGPSCADDIAGPVDEAFCEIEVEGHGTVDMEEEYLTNVIFCENGLADKEALKAMAIAARSVAYWEIGYNGDICDSTDCQVFSCDGEPQAKHIEAVRETRGQYLYFEDQVTYGFYVRGDEPDEYCEGGSDESFVTYNEGRNGTNVEQTNLGWVSEPGEGVYGQNRGCMSQLGMQCLEGEWEYDYVEILQYYYGKDIQVAQAQGPCVGSTPDDAPSTTTTTSGGNDTSSTTTTSTSGGSGDTRGSDSDTGSRPRPGDTSTSTSTSTSTTTSGDSASGDSGDDSRGDTRGDTDTPDTDGGDTDTPDTDGSDSASESDSASGGSDSDSDDSRGDDGGSNGDDEYDPYGDESESDGDSRGGNDPGPSPWGSGGDGDTDTDTDGAGSTTEASGCSVAGAGERNSTLLFGLMGLLLFRVRSRRRA